MFTSQMHSSDWIVAFFLSEIYSHNSEYWWYKNYRLTKEENSYGLCWILFVNFGIFPISNKQPGERF